VPVNLAILIAGVAGLAIAVFGFVALTRDAARRHQWLDIALAALLVVIVVWFLLSYGDRILR
jgi:glucose uptake protein GlcU